MAKVELLKAFEKALGSEIASTQAEKFLVVKDAVNWINEHLQSKQTK